MYNVKYSKVHMFGVFGRYNDLRELRVCKVCRRHARLCDMKGTGEERPADYCL